MKLIKTLKSILQKISGEAEYKSYLRHYKKHHKINPKGHKPLSKQDFFAQKEKNKWKTVNRCC